MQNDEQGAYTSVDALLQLRNLAADITLDTRRKSSAAMDGDSRTRFRGRGMEFAEVRAYQAGDDIRTIDWRVTARTQKPYTKLFQEERERPVFIVTDQRSPMFFGSQLVFKSVLAAQLATTIAWAALQNNDRIGALIFGDKEQKDLRAKRGKHAVLGLIHQLCNFNAALTSPTNASDFTTAEILNDIRRVAKPGSAVFIISDFSDVTQECEKPLSLLSRHSNVSLIKVFDPLEIALPSSQISVSNGRERLKIYPGDKAFYEQFQSTFNQQEALIQTICRNTKTACFKANATVPVRQWVYDVFSSRKNKHAHGTPLTTQNRSPQQEAIL